MKALILAIVLLLMAPSMVLAQSPSPSVEQAAFANAITVVQDFKSLLKDGINQWIADPLSKPVLETALGQGMKNLVAVTVYDCFAEWYGLQYTTFLIVSSYIATLNSPDELTGPTDPQLAVAVTLSQFASVIEVNC